MKRYDEGYALALVLVVLVVVCLVAASILTLAVDNLTAQQNFVSRMQEEYTAKGKMEQIQANLELDIQKRSVQPENAEKQYKINDSLLTSIIDGITNQYSLDMSKPAETNEPEEQNLAIHGMLISATVFSGEVQIQCEYLLSGTAIYLEQVTFEEGTPQPKTIETYVIENPELKIIKYEITTVEPTETTVSGEESEPT